MKNAIARLLSLSFLVALPALPSCEPTLQPIDVAPGCPDQPLRGPEEFADAPPESMIDDFEDGDLLLTRIAGRTGSWSGTPVAPTVFGEASTRCVARGTHSGHLTATGLPDYGANWNASMIDPLASALPYDASAYSGFSFWIATGDNAVPPIEIPIGVTTTDSATAGGICTVCGDYYAIRTRIPLTHTWTRWVVPFTDLAQNGFGMPQVPLRKNQLVSLIIWPEKSFDIWIDDVRFEP